MTSESDRNTLAMLLQGEPLQPSATLRERVLADASRAIGQRAEPLGRPLLIAAVVLVLGLVSSRNADRELGASLARPDRVATHAPSWYTPPRPNPWLSLVDHNVKTRTLLASIDSSQPINPPKTKP